MENIEFARTKAVIESLAGKTKEAINWRAALKLGLLGAGMATTGALAAEGIEAVGTKVKAKRYFNKMLSSNPDLKRKKQSIKPYFRSLMHFAPEVAGDPLAAGSFIRRAHEFKDVGFPLQDVEALSRVHSAQRRNSFADTLRGPLSGFAGAKGKK